MVTSVGPSFFLSFPQGVTLVATLDPRGAALALARGDDGEAWEVLGKDMRAKARAGSRE